MIRVSGAQGSLNCISLPGMVTGNLSTAPESRFTSNVPV